MKKRIFTGLAIGSVFIYVLVLYYLLFKLVGRETITVSEDMHTEKGRWYSVIDGS
ncbi:hypothetical protein M2146_002445 [Lachnospiraceae bacterium PF1-22]|uniref:hypothetical protein n=1 Tax=Ohessyouella blattaphilus TaxID=2949333 RepID=UPI003E1DDC00